MGRNANGLANISDEDLDKWLLEELVEEFMSLSANLPGLRGELQETLRCFIERAKKHEGGMCRVNDPGQTVAESNETKR